MKVLIYSINYFPEMTGIGKYTTEMAEWLAINNHEIRVITTPPYYPHWKIWDGYSNRYSRARINSVTVFRCPVWLPSNFSPVKRILHLFSFFISSFPICLVHFFWKPDIIFLNEPPLICAPTVHLLSRITKSKTWLHIQDFEIDIFLGFSTTMPKMVSRAIKFIETKMTNQFNRVTSISGRMVEKISEKKITPNKISYFPNWVDSKFVNPDNRDVDFRKTWGISKDKFVVLYSGTIGNKQGIEIICSVASLLREHVDIVFLVVGDGVGKQKLVDIVKIEKLTNVTFKPTQPFEFLPGLLNCADLHLVVQKKSFADTVLPSKLVTILSAGGVSLITAGPDTELSNLIKFNKDLALITEPENAEQLAGKIVAIQSDKALQQRIKKVAREFAVNNFDKDNVLINFENKLKQLVTTPS